MPPAVTSAVLQNTGSGGPSAPENPNDPANNRYITELNKMKSQAAFGINAQDAIAAKSGGRTDYTKQILFSIRRQYFTWVQVGVISYWWATMGMFVGAITMAALTNSLPDFSGSNTSMILGVFLLSMGISDMTSQMQAHRNIKTCTKDKFKSTDYWVYKLNKAKAGDSKVDPEYQGNDCMTDWDCTKKSQVPRGVCKLPKPNALSRIVRGIVTPILLLAGIILTATSFSSTDFRLAKADLAQAIIYGIAAGNFVAVLFS